MRPDLEGVRVLEQLQADPPLSGTAALMVTGEQERPPQVRALPGEEDVLLEPFAVQELLTRVGAVTGGPVR